MATKEIKSMSVYIFGKRIATLHPTETAADPQVSYALDSFKAKKIMEFTVDGKKHLVPFHAVDYIVVTSSKTEVEDRPNPYGCESSSGDAKVCSAKVGC